MDHAEIHVSLAGIRPDANGFRIGFGRLLQFAGLLLGHAQIEPAIEAFGGVFGELGAIAQSGFVVAGGEGAGGQAFQRGLRIGTQRQ